jgi:predicted deacylase
LDWFIVEILVKLNQKVEVGQKVAIQRDTFGEVVAEYSSAVAGDVSGYRTDATAEPGTPLVFVFYNAMPEENPVDYAE